MLPALPSSSSSLHIQYSIYNIYIYIYITNLIHNIEQFALILILLCSTFGFQLQFQLLVFRNIHVTISSRQKCVIARDTYIPQQQQRSNREKHMLHVPVVLLCTNSRARSCMTKTTYRSVFFFSLSLTNQYVDALLHDKRSCWFLCRIQRKKKESFPVF